MSDEKHNVNFHDFHGNYFTGMLVTRRQAQQILELKQDKRLHLDGIRWICLQDASDPPDGTRVYQYYHGAGGGYGYLTAPEDELRSGLITVLQEDDD